MSAATNTDPNAVNTTKADSGIQEMTLEAFHAALKAQGVQREHLALVCPMCRTVQSASDFITAGAGADFDAVEKYLGFSCIGRFTGGASPRRKPDGQACDWTLGGFFRLHRLEVITPDGQRHPRFEVATPEQATAHRDRITKALAQDVTQASADGESFASSAAGGH